MIKSQQVKEAFVENFHWSMIFFMYHYLLHSWSDGRCHSWAWILMWTLQMVIKYLAASMDEVALILQFILCLNK